MLLVPQKIKCLTVVRQRFTAVFQILLSQIFGSKFLLNIIKVNLSSF